MAETDKLALISNIAASYLRRNSVSIDQICTVVSSVTRAIEEAAKEIGGSAVHDPQTAPIQTEHSPAVPIKKSIQREYIVCLEDGMHARTLKRHLNSAHGMTPDQYREKWGLPDD
jgi:predicted transcriptional regulator